MSDRKVVVETSITVVPVDDRPMFAGRIPELALTAYGRTEKEAIDAVKRQQDRFVEAYHKLGLLEKRLDQVGVKWHWETTEDDHTG